MDKQFFIIMACPGGGKSTQAGLLKQKLEETYPEVIHATTGGTFREFIKDENFVASKARAIQNDGGLQPEFLAIWNWTNIFINRLHENTTVILDGAPRKVVETEAIHALFPFLGYRRPHVIYIEVTRSWAKERMIYRESQSVEKREDSSDDEEIEKRIDLFDEDILPCVELLKNDPRYSFVRINGEQTIEKVHEDIMASIAG